MFNKKSLLILLVIALISLTGVAYSQAEFSMGFSGAFGIALNVGMTSQDITSETYVVDLDFAPVDSTIFSINPMVSGTLFESDSSSFSVFTYGTISWNHDLSSGFGYYFGYASWMFQPNMTLELGFGYSRSYLTFSYAMDMLTVNVSLQEEADYGSYTNGIEHDGTTGLFALAGASDYDFIVALNGIDVSPLTIDFALKYTFVNTYKWDDTAEYWNATDLVWERGREKAGKLTIDLDLNAALEGLLDITFNEKFTMGFTSSKWTNRIDLTVDVLAVEDLIFTFVTNFNMSAAPETSPADVIAIFPEEPLTMGLYVGFIGGYSLDIGGPILSLYLKGGAQLDGVLGMNGINDTSKPWWLRAGINVDLAGGYVSIPIDVTITNKNMALSNNDGTRWVSWSDMGYYSFERHLFGRAGNLFTNTYFNIGLNFSF